MNIKLLLISSFCFVNIVLGCSKDNDQHVWEGYLESHEVVLNQHANDTLIKFNCKGLTSILKVAEFVERDTIHHEFDYNLNILQGEWFRLTLLDDAINIQTTEYSNDTERKLKIYFIFEGKGDYLDVIQKNTLEKHL